MYTTQPTPGGPVPPQDVTQQVTSETPTTKPAKNPKWVAAGKAIAEKKRLACEAQKKAAAEAAVIISNNKAKETPAHPCPEDEKEEDVNDVGPDTHC